MSDLPPDPVPDFRPEALLSSLPPLFPCGPAAARPPAETRVVVAMSGGVDSSVTAALLACLGYQVIGLTMQLYDHGMVIEGSKTCCAGQDIYDASRVADHLGIPHFVVDYEKSFLGDVMTAFADSYVAGETPVPCVLCNQTVKFRDLVQAARDLGADALATGHYVGHHLTADGNGQLWRGSDHGRDQSYFLFSTPREQLPFLRFPLGSLGKEQTRQLARHFGLEVADKPDSQDICFVPDGNYARVVEQLRPGAIQPGLIVHEDGTILGKHQGIINFTVGQRRGLDIGGTADRLYVLRLEPATRRVIVGPRQSLACTVFHLRDVNWLGDTPWEAALAGLPPEEGLLLSVKVRNSFPPAAARIFPGPAQTARVHLLSAVEGVAPGQACVFYDGERMLGGGWITRPDKTTMPETPAPGATRPAQQGTAP